MSAIYVHLGAMIGFGAAGSFLEQRNGEGSGLGIYMLCETSRQKDRGSLLGFRASDTIISGNQYRHFSR